MMKFDSTKSVWYERYKPQTVDDVILPQEIKNKIKSFLEKDMPCLGFWSSEPGLGKSSLANAIIKDLNCDALWVNASMERSIEDLRSKIQKFASQCSFNGDYKVVVLDEFDNTSKDYQMSFRSFLDTYSQNCRFILTGNFKDKIIEPLLDRLVNFEFNKFNKEEMLKPIYERLAFILDNENIKYNPKDVAQIIFNFFPKIRSMVGFLQKACENGELVLKEELDDKAIYDDLMKSLKGNFVELVQRVNKLNAPDNVYGFIYKNALDYFPTEKYASIILICAKYQQWSSSVRDKNLNLCACLTEIRNLI